MIKKLTILLASSLLVIPATGNAQIIPRPPERPHTDANGVDLFSQQLSYSVPMLSIGPKGRGGLEYIVYYSGGTFRSTFDTLLETDTLTSSSVATVGNYSESFPYPGYGSLGQGAFNGSKNVYLGDGTDIFFGFQLPVPGISPIQYDLVEYKEYPDGVRETFHYRVDAGGGYDQARLQSVTTNTGWQLKFNYQANSMTSSPASVAPWKTKTSVVAINNSFEYCDPSADTCTIVNSWPETLFSDTSTTRLFTDASGGVTEFDISAFNLFRVKTPDSSTFNYDYTYDNNVTVPGGGTEHRIVQASINGKATDYLFAYSGLNQTVTTSAPLSQSSTYAAVWQVPVITSVVDPLSRTTSFLYDGFGRATRATPPEGDYLKIDYLTSGTNSPRGIISDQYHYPKTGMSGSPLHSSWTYDTGCTSATLKPCNSPLTATMPTGGTSVYTYDSVHGGMLTEISEVNGNGIPTSHLYGYTQHYAWIKNAAGAYVQAPTPVWLRTSDLTCRVSTGPIVSGACSSGATDETLTSYDYGPNSGPNNLLLRGKVVTSNGVSLRTCYGYDNLGNKISETTPNAGLTSCP